MAGMSTDPWGDEPTAATATLTAPSVMPVSPVVVTDDETLFPCPHCETPLTPHNDMMASLHCYDPRCSNCCFLPPDETSDGLARLKVEQHACKMAQRMANSF